jgi:hypothetical protein
MIYTSERSTRRIVSQANRNRKSLAFLFKDLITLLSLKNALCLAIVAVSFLIARPVYSADTKPLNPDVCAQAYADFDDKSRMLTAKYELWAYGSTKAMAIHEDGSYIGKNRPVF